MERAGEREKSCRLYDNGREQRQRQNKSVMVANTRNAIVSKT